MAAKKNDKPNNNQLSSSQSIRKLLRQRWLIVVLALILTGLGAALTGIIFKSGIKVLETWRLEFLSYLPAWILLPLIGTLGGFIS